MQTAALVVIILIGLGFDFTNGFHDAANSIATSVSTRALTPRVALGMSALLNLIGALVSTKVATTVGKGIVSSPSGSRGLLLVFAALFGAVVWNLITWYFGLPSSSTHALIGGLVGATLASAGAVKWHGVLSKVIIPMVVSPLVGLGLGFVVMMVLLWLFRRGNPSRLNRNFRGLQTLSAAAMSYSHGTQDAQKTMGVLTLALYSTGHLSRFAVPLWVIFAAAAAIAFGTYAGGWRIIRTLGRRVIKLDPPRGFAAEASASAVLLFSAYGYAVPVSSTHVITSAVMGVGATKRLSAVRWGVAGNIAAAWVLTLPAAGLIAAGVFALGRAIIF